MNQRKKILFITGTRADYGKIKPIMQKMEKKQKEYEVFVYVSGMHLLQKYGSTYREVQKDGYKNTYVAFEQVMTDNMSYNLGVVLMNLARYAEQIKPDMIVVHGDRIDALAGAITGALNNILVAHIEGARFPAQSMIRSGMRFLSLLICTLCAMRKQKKDCFRWVSRMSVFS